MLTFPGPWSLDVDGLRSRLVLTAVAGAQFLGGLLVALPLAILVTVSLATVPAVGVGLLLLFVTVPLTGAWGSWQRRVVGELLDRPVPGHHLAPAASGPWRRIMTWLRDPVRRRDLAHVWFSATVGAALSGLVVVAFGTPITHLVLGIVLEEWSWWFAVLTATAAVMLWWLLTPALARLRLGMDAAILGERRTTTLQRRVEQVTRTRDETLDHSAAEVRRIERDLHDGAQARLVALGMHLGMAEELLETDPAAAAELLGEARDSTQATLEELRAIVRAIHPPLLADRGLVGAVEALALELPVPVTVTAELDDALPAPIESAVYFAIAECLTNVAKHAGAQRCWLVLRGDGVRLDVVVGDDGRGGAHPQGGSGLEGLERRLAAFDGTMEVISPVGGGTRVRMEVPCAPSSRRTTRS
ncbi:sensor histidine kinase [Aeromicrobium sp. CTD01-1L150]|uniref:sensor histidine kinase n=1 Tax=Aeromicrobium sp. CTD01-1L150 TaxID=3341830 RepID=UPI0035C0808F